MRKFMTEEKKREITASICDIAYVTLERLGLGCSVCNTILFTCFCLNNIAECRFGRAMLDALVIGYSIETFTCLKRDLSE